MTEQVLEQVALAVNGTTKAKFGDIELDFAGPYLRLSITDAIHQYTGLNVDALDEAAIREQCRAWGMEVTESMGKGKLIDEIFGEKVEEFIIQPTFIIR
jgi:lysyl-tRNA synthetase class 2